MGLLMLYLLQMVMSLGAALSQFLLLGKMLLFLSSSLCGYVPFESHHTNCKLIGYSGFVWKVTVVKCVPIIASLLSQFFVGKDSKAIMRFI